MTEIKRKLYKRGSSYETTIPLPILFSIDTKKPHYVVFKYEEGKWYLEFEEMKE